MSRRHSRFALFALAFVFANGLGAQDVRVGTSATVSGTVRDSIANANLANAVIQLVGVDNPSTVFDAVSDSLGRFRINNVSIGHYRIGFFHPILDSLGVEAPVRDVYVNSYSAVTANVGVPSASTLRGAVCGSKPGAGFGAVIVGTVRDAKDGVPMSKVSVFGEWYEFALTRTGMARQLARRSVTSADNGWFALCNLPTDGTVALVATTGVDSTGIIEVQVPKSGFVRRELYLGAEEMEDAPNGAIGNVSTPGSATPRHVRMGNGSISGTVTTVEGNRPLANAQVAIIDGPQTRTDVDGRWKISNAPTGTRRLEVRALGYYPDARTVNVIAGAASLRIQLLTLKAMLDTVKIRASRLPTEADGKGFNYRRRAGVGRYITAEDLERLPVMVISEVFRRMPGMRTDGARKKIEMRGAFATWCEAAIFIDDHYMSFLTKEDIDDWVQPNHIAGIEVYSEASVPAQFRVGMGECGSIVIWTK